MKKIAILALVIVGIGAGYTASAWFFGKQAEANLSAQYDHVLETASYIEIVDRDYQRGIFESDETLTLELFRQLIETMSKQADDGGQAAPIDKPLRLTIHTHIQHGPLPGFSNLAAAVIDSELVLPEEVKQDVAKLLGDKSPFSEHTIIHYDGTGYATFTSPKFEVSLPEPTGETNNVLNIAWQGIDGEMTFSADLKHTSMKALAPLLTLSSSDGFNIRLSDMRIEGDQQRIFDDIALLFSGSQRLSIGEVAMTSPDNQQKPLVLKQLTYDIDLPSDGTFIDLNARLGMGNLQFGEDSIGPLHFDYSIKHLHARALAEISQAFMGLYSDPALLAGDSEAFAAQILPVLSTQGATIMNNAPEFHLDRVSFANTHGEASLAARVKLAALDLEEAAANPFLLISKLEASGELRLQEEMILEMLRNPPGKEEMGLSDLSPEELEAQSQMMIEQFQQQVAMLTEQGYVIREGQLLKSDLEFKEGQLLVNGIPFMPLGEQPIIEEGAAWQEDDTALQEDGAVLQEDAAALQEDGAVLQENGATMQ
jgi:uncharacterized protein YdgA (DUF945 family)